MNGTEEEFVPEEEAEEGPGLVKRLREKLKKAVEEKQEYLEGWQRARADFANYKKEEAAMHADKEDRIRAAIIEDLIPMLDTLELARKHDDSKTLEIVEKTFLSSLRNVGVERFGNMGEPFDPNIHEALSKDSEDHVVKEVKRSGYKLKDRIIRPAQVIL